MLPLRVGMPPFPTPFLIIGRGDGFGGLHRTFEMHHNPKLYKLKQNVRTVNNEGFFRKNLGKAEV